MLYFAIFIIFLILLGAYMLGKKLLTASPKLRFVDFGISGVNVNSGSALLDINGNIWTAGSNDRGMTAQGTYVGNTQTFTKVASSEFFVKIVSLKPSTLALINDQNELFLSGRLAPNTTSQDSNTLVRDEDNIICKDASILSGNGAFISDSDVLLTGGINLNYTTGQGTDVGTTEPIATTTPLIDDALAISQTGSITAVGAVIRLDGTLWTWGQNDFGATAQGTFSGDTQNPTQVGSDTDWIDVAVGNNCIHALKSDGTIYSSGDGTFIGQGDDTDINVMTQIGTDSDWVQISCQNSHALALKQNGTLWAWGTEAGTGLNASTTLSPTQVGTDGDWFKVRAGTGASLAQKVDGRMYGTGSNAEYVLGLPLAQDYPTFTLIDTFTDL